MLKSYLLRDIPAGLWARVARKARSEGFTLRGLILQLLKRYADGELELLEKGTVG